MIRTGLRPYVKGMLRTIGQAGAGERGRGKGDLRAAVSGIKLLIDTIGSTANDSEAIRLIRELHGAAKIEVDETDYFENEEEEDEDLETLHKAIDKDYEEEV
jgi:hypothetical protein